MRLPTDSSVGSLRLSFSQENGPKNLTVNLPLDQKIRGFVLEVFSGGALLSFSGKKIRTVTDGTSLFVGEILTLVVKQGTKGVELKILEREWSDGKNLFLKTDGVGVGIAELTEKILGGDSKEASPEISILKILKSYYPFFEWSADLPYFSWELPGGNAEGIYSPKEEEKKFLFRIQTEKTGRTLVLFIWKELSGEDLQINVTFDNFKMYLHACQNREKFKRILIESSVNFQGYNLAYKPSLTQKEWNA
ncbi:hypothetical protein AB3N59_09585 [Leptospira sp. WS92.C1]